MPPSFTKPHAPECKTLKPALAPQIARLPEITQLLFDPNEQIQEEATREFRKLLSIGHDPFHMHTEALHTFRTKDACRDSEWDHKDACRDSEWDQQRERKRWKIKGKERARMVVSGDRP